MPPVDQPAPIQLEKTEERPVGELGPAPIPRPQDDIGNKPFAPRSAAERTAAVTAAPTITIGVVPTLPVRAGLLITWTATATGGVAPYQYLFARYSFATAAWTVVRPYSGTNTFAWTPTQAEVGKYMLQVWVLNSGSSATFDAYKTTAAFDILSSLPTITSVTANTTFPRLYGNAITWTANATGGIAPLQYRFIRYSYTTAAWTIVRDYSTSNTFTWTPTLAEVGKYSFQVWVLNAGSTAFYDAYTSTAPFDISGPPPTITSFTSSPASPSPAGVAMTWTAVATGGIAPLQYLFALYDAQAGTWSVPQNYGASNTFTWIPTASQAGQYQIQVWVRNNGSGTTYDAFKGVPFTIGPMQPLAVSGFPVLPGLPRPVGTTLIWQANTTGGMAPLQYAFYRYSATTGTWTLAQNWSTSKLFTWTPAPAEAGDYSLQVWVRNAGTSVRLRRLRQHRSVCDHAAHERHRPLPRAGHLRADERRHRAGPADGHVGVDRRSVRDGPDGVSAFHAGHRQPVRRLHGQLPAGQLLDLPAAAPVLLERAVRSGPAAPAGGVGSALARRDLRPGPARCRAGTSPTSTSSTATPSATTASSSTR